MVRRLVHMPWILVTDSGLSRPSHDDEETFSANVTNLQYRAWKRFDTTLPPSSPKACPSSLGKRGTSLLTLRSLPLPMDLSHNLPDSSRYPNHTLSKINRHTLPPARHLLMDSPHNLLNNSHPFLPRAIRNHSLLRQISSSLL